MGQTLVGTRIVVTDDEPMIRDIVARKLAAQGAECVTAVDGDTAKKAIADGGADLLLLDVRMPNCYGIDVLRDVREAYPDVAVVMMTAVADVKVAIEALRLGAYDYIIKPVDLNLLLLSLDRALEKRELLLENRGYQTYLEERVRRQTERLRGNFLNSVKSLAIALEAKDRYTRGHSERVARLSVAIAKELGMDEDRIEKIRTAGLIHDIGKIGVREVVLNKQGPLDETEREHVKAHCEIGEEILRPVVEDEEILLTVRHHHERYDGSGYPDRLVGETIPEAARIIAVADSFVHGADSSDSTHGIPEGARIIAVADAFDAMTSDRPYRQAAGMDVALAELAKQKGKQFDPRMVDALLQAVRKDPSVVSHQ